MDEPRREQLEDLFEHVLQKREHLVLHREHAVEDAPPGRDLERLAAVAELRVCGNGRTRVSGHLDLGHDRDEAVSGVAHDLAHVVLRVEAAVGLAGVAPRGRIARRRSELAVRSPGADVSQLRVALDLDAPALIVGEVPVEDVELVQRQQIQVLADGFLGHEMACDVEVAAAPGEARPVLDIQRGHPPGDVRHPRAPEDRRWKQLQQCLCAACDAGGAARDQSDLPGSHAEAVALVAERAHVRLEPEDDARTGCPSDDRQRQRGGRTKRVAQLLGQRAKGGRRL